MLPPLHKKLASALSDASTWASLSAVTGTLGTQLPAPHSQVAYTASAVSAVLGILIKGGGNAGTPAE